MSQLDRDYADRAELEALLAQQRRNADNARMALLVVTLASLWALFTAVLLGFIR